MTVKHTLIFLGLLLIILPAVSGQDGRSHIRRGNNLYNEGNFSEAELEYRRALELDSRDSRALFNLGNSLYRQGRFEEAAELFDVIAQTAAGDAERSDAFHNKGNALLGAQQYGESVDAYKNALRLNPEDDDTRYNLAYAMQFLEDPPPQDQQQDQDQQDDQDQDQQDDQDQDQQPQDDHEQNDQQQEQQQRPDQLSRQEAERILDALNQQEQKVQENVTREDRQQTPAKVEREW